MPSKCSTDKISTEPESSPAKSLLLTKNNPSHRNWLSNILAVVVTVVVAEEAALVTEVVVAAVDLVVAVVAEADLATEVVVADSEVAEEALEIEAEVVAVEDLATEVVAADSAVLEEVSAAVTVEVVDSADEDVEPADQWAEEVVEDQPLIRSKFLFVFRILYSILFITDLLLCYQFDPFFKGVTPDPTVLFLLVSHP